MKRVKRKFLVELLKIGIAFLIIIMIPNAKIGIFTVNIAGRVGLIAKDITIDEEDKKELLDIVESCPTEAIVINEN